MTKERSKPYNVELLKLAVPVATAIFVALLTGWTGYTYSQLTQSQNAIIAKRTELYDKIVKNTNANSPKTSAGKSTSARRYHF